MAITVIKNDNRQEAFQPDKINRVLKAAWCNNPEADKLTQTIVAKIYALNLTEVTSAQIRDMVLNELKQTDKQAYNFFRWYQNTGRNYCPVTPTLGK